MRFPALFIAHGSPMIALEEGGEYARALRRFADALPRPRAIVVVSAHWEEEGPIRVTAAERPEPIYDFGGFPDELYRLDYPSPGAPGLAGEIVSLLEGRGLEARADPARGWDHGVWIPLRLTYPRAEVPVVEFSLPSPRTPEVLLRMGSALAPLRDGGVLIFGSGGIVHNLRRARLDRADAPADEWARRFDDWVRVRLERLDRPALARYRELAPDAALAAPTPEHFDPLFVVLGAALGGDRVETIYEGFTYGSLSMRSFALVPPKPSEPEPTSEPEEK